MSVLTRESDAAERLVAAEYERLKPEVLRTVAAKLASAGVRLPELDLEAIYNEAWHALYVKLRAGEDVASHVALLVTIAHRRALNEHRALHLRRWADPAELEGVGHEPELDARVDERRRLRLLVEGLRARFDQRQRQAAALCYLYDYSRPEAARALGVTPRRMEKIMDAVAKQMRELLGATEAGDRCAEQASLMRAYAVGLLDEKGERYRLARDHLDHCSACRSHVLALRGLAAVAPPVPFVLAGATLGGGAAAGATAVPGDAGLAGVGVTGGATAAAGSGGAGLAAGAAGVAGTAAREGAVLGWLGSRAAAAIGGTGAAAVAVAVAVGVGIGGTGTGTGGDGTSPVPAAPQAPAVAPASTTADRDAAREQRRQAERRRARRRAAAPTRTTTAPRDAASAPAPSTPPSAATPAPTPAPQPPPVPDPTPAPAPQRTPEPAPARDGAEEFELR